MRYLRAFFTALQMTLRGEQPPAPSHAALRHWIEETVKLVDQVVQIADENGLDQQTRKALQLRLDGRNINMETLIITVRYHATEEYPHLLNHQSRHVITAIYASNLDDRYRVASLKDAVDIAPVKAAVVRLSNHLDAIPPTHSG